MPHITVDHSGSLTASFDRPGFARALHPLVAEIAKTSAAGCKTRFRRVDETFVADGAPEHAVIHVDVALKPGRTGAVKAELTEAVLALLLKHVAPTPGVTVHASVDLRELDDAYAKHIVE
ncbi:5-carboxymethyl-2-hydroxymuconate Delta-isomerase [Streptomyces abyssomicinicus]|uniref:5-carboxymethyl-2-hydroxymuconate Delta-isomerase n=1 Tax=Streptomyces abyssomicinicus TaxID=574929 RepID=UPI00124FA378|nr:isomerase [Streptomyces abyssomicinicus]